MTSSSLHVLVVDDETPAREELIWLLEQSERSVTVVGQAHDASSALKALGALEARGAMPHLIFLDVDMPGVDGMRLASLIRARHGQDVALAFVTAYKDYAFDAFEVDAIDYLLKPVRSEHLARVLSRVKPPQAPAAADVRTLDRISVEERGAYRVIPLDEVLCFEAHDGIVFAQTRQGRYLTEFSLKFLEQNLDTAGVFFRSHRSAIVRVGAIERIAPWGAGTYRLVLDEAADIGVPLARSRASELKSLMPWSASALDE